MAETNATANASIEAIAKERFGPLSRGEYSLLLAALSGDVADCCFKADSGQGLDDDPAGGHHWGPERTIRATMLEWVCTDRAVREQVHVSGIRVMGALIDGRLDLSYRTLVFPLDCVACCWPQGIELTGASLVALTLTRCWVGPAVAAPQSGAGSFLPLSARSLRVGNSVTLDAGFHAEGAVLLADANIGGDLRCDDATFVSNEGLALRAADTKVCGSVLLRNRFKALGGVTLLRAEIGGVLDCAGGQFKRPTGYALNIEAARIVGPTLLRSEFTAEGEVRAFDANIGGNLDCTNARIRNSGKRALSIDAAKIGGAALLRNGFTAEGEVQLSAAEIKRDLSCVGATLRNPAGSALVAIGLKIGGDALLGNGCSADGGVELTRAEIGGVLDCAGGQFKSSTAYAIHIQGGTIDGAVLLRNGFTVEGEVRAFAARIGGDLDCTGSTFRNGGKTTLSFEAANIGGAVLLRNGFTAEGQVQAFSASIGGDLDCSNGHFHNRGKHALDFAAAKIGGAAMLSDGFTAEGSVRLFAAVIDELLVGGEVKGGADLTSAPRLDLDGIKVNRSINLVGLHLGPGAIVSLRDASCNVLVDDPEAAWPDTSEIWLDGFSYRRIFNPGRPETRLEWLRRHIPRDRRGRRGGFWPQPYRQLAAILRTQGLESEARQILIGLARDRRRWSDLHWGSRVWQFLLWISIRNGYQPLRAIYGLVILWFIGFLAFGWGFQANVMLPTERVAYEHVAKGEPLPGYYENFCAVIYGVDNLPIISFGQRDHWHPEAELLPAPQREQHGLLYSTLCEAQFLGRLMELHQVSISRSTLATSLVAFRWFHLTLGWFLATMLVAGISGLVGRD